MAPVPQHRVVAISSVFGVQLVNSIVHHTTHVQPFVAAVSVLDVACTLTLMVSLVYLGFAASRPPRCLISGSLWALLLWVFGVVASSSVMRLVDPASMDADGMARALAATLVLAPVALALGALGAWRASRHVAS